MDGLARCFDVNSEFHIRENLALAHQLTAFIGLDDLTYTHITARSVRQPDTYYIARLGVLFEEVTADDILHINASGEVIEGEGVFNITGHYIHQEIYAKNPHINAVIHTHTPNTIAVATLKAGLLPWSQFSFLFYENIGTTVYDALALGAQKTLVADLGNYPALLMQNHGAVTVGKTLHEAFFYMMFLEKAADVQLKLMAAGGDVHAVAPETCRQARDQMIQFEPDLGRRDWDALARKLAAY